MVLCLALCAACLPALGELMQYEGESYFLTLDSVQLVDGALQVVVSGFGNKVRIQDGQIVTPFWAYAMSAGKKTDAASVRVDVNGVYTYLFELDELPDEVCLYAQDDKADSALLWQNTGEAQPEPEAASDAPAVDFVVGENLADTLFLTLNVFEDDDALLRNAYAYLLEGGTIREGERSDHARAMRFLINALSPARERIAEEGDLDASSTEALGKIRRALGMPERDAVDAKDFLQLLTGFCCWMEPDKTKALLMDEGMTEAEFHQFCGTVYTLKGWPDLAAEQFAMMEASGVPDEAPVEEREDEARADATAPSPQDESAFALPARLDWSNTFTDLFSLLSPTAAMGGSGDYLVVQDQLAFADAPMKLLLLMKPDGPLACVGLLPTEEAQADHDALVALLSKTASGEIGNPITATRYLTNVAELMKAADLTPPTFEDVRVWTQPDGTMTVLVTQEDATDAVFYLPPEK